LNEALSWLNVDDGRGDRRRLFTAAVHRLKATYNFTNRAFARAIAEYVRSDQNPALYSSAVPLRNGALLSSILLAYKLNWQSVLFLGYGDSQALDDRYEWRRQDRQVFLKVSYAVQR
jgi:hypothetical protein